VSWHIHGTWRAGVLIGHRFLQKMEDTLTKAGCCRIMTCVPDTRLSLAHWLLARGYSDVSATPYPAEAAGHSLLPSKESTALVMFAKPLRLLPPPPKATSQEEYAKAATATFIGQDRHLEEGEGEEENAGVPLPPAENSHLPPHWRGVQGGAAATPTAAASKE
jgi:hypothetical protein